MSRLHTYTPTLTPICPSDTNTNPYTHIPIHPYTHIPIHTYTHIPISPYTHISAWCDSLLNYSYLLIHTHTYSYILIHTHTYSYIVMQLEATSLLQARSLLGTVGITSGLKGVTWRGGDPFDFYQQYNKLVIENGAGTGAGAGAGAGDAFSEEVSSAVRRWSALRNKKHLHK
jgi:hypothetical protein